MVLVFKNSLDFFFKDDLFLGTLLNKVFKFDQIEMLCEVAAGILEVILNFFFPI